MPKVYETFEVIHTDPTLGSVVLSWIDTNDPDGPRLERSHKIPTEPGAESWDEATFRSYFVFEVEDVADIPAWMYAEERLTTRASLIAKRRSG